VALLAESLVEEWLNRMGFFTVRGIRRGVGEIDLLGVRQERFDVLTVGSRIGATLRRFGLSVTPRFLWECLTSRAVNWFPIPAASNGACGFAALRSPVVFASKVNRPMKPKSLSAAALAVSDDSH
jgi:hypothetical protein